MKKLFILILLPVLIGCETVVEIDVPRNRPSLVINSTLNPDSLIHINLSESRYILDNYDFRYVENASVSVYEDGVLLDTLSHGAEGNYFSSSIKPKRNKDYQILASASGFVDASAEVLIPKDSITVLSVSIDSVVQNNGFGGYITYQRINVEMQDNASINNFYSVSLLGEYYYYQYNYDTNPPTLVDSTFVSTLEYFNVDDPYFEDYNSGGTELIFNDELFNGKTYTLRILNSYYEGDDGFPYSSNPTYTLLLRNTSESYYLYKNTVSLQSWTSDNPFAQPVQVYTNVTNGYGILSAYNTTFYKVN
ncbi:MAG: DUF4249 domain-containing protein [Cyclobacteriaceae bacterium]|nr:DUF4249 domain-containing protein [Cyclobacteriaceae bacterium]